jgi:ABC-type sulfate/molybdate transport systems ATPase subunit/ABC-type sulfate transport system permease component
MITRRTFSPLNLLGGLLGLYLLMPIAYLLLDAATTRQRGFGAPGLWAALVTSLVTATEATAIIALLGVPLAYVLARSHGWLAKSVGIGVQIPLAIPPLVAGILLLSLVGPYTPLGRLFGRHLTDSVIGIVICQTFVAAPFLVVAARSAFTSTPGAFDDVGATLGMGEWQRFWKIALPLAAPGIQAGLLLSWLRALGEFGATVIVAYHPYSLPVFTYVQFSQSGLTNTLAPAVLVLATAIVVLLIAQARPARRRRIAPHVAPVPPPPRVAVHLSMDLDHEMGSFRLRLAHRSTSPHLAILGPSGSGKSTALRLLAGLGGSSSSQVAIDDRPIGAIPAERRHVGYVPQDASLFPHRTVWEQLIMGPRAQPGRARYWLDHLDLDGFENRYPSELSGGQRQRVALARALSSDPDLLLLDEPFSALDTPVRHELQRKLRQLFHETNVPSVLVTHDPEEAAMLSDELIVISGGLVLQAGQRRDVFSFPETLDVAHLLGLRNVGVGLLRSLEVLHIGRARISLNGHGSAPASAVLWSIDPDRVALTAIEESNAESGLAITDSMIVAVVDIIDMGSTFEVDVTSEDGQGFVVRTKDPAGLVIGRPYAMKVPDDAVSIWMPSGRATPHDPASRRFDIPS